MVWDISKQTGAEFFVNKRTSLRKQGLHLLRFYLILLQRTLGPRAAVFPHPFYSYKHPVRYVRRREEARPKVTK